MPLQQETLHRLNGVASRLEEITHRLQEPAVVQDHTQYRSLMKEYDRLVPVVEAYKAYGRAQDAAEEAKALLDERGLEPEFWEMVQQELKKIPRDKVREIAAEHIKDICSSNRRDFRF